MGKGILNRGTRIHKVKTKYNRKKEDKMSVFYNITGSTGVTVELIEPGIGVIDIDSILLTNVHASNDATVTLFIQDDPPGGSASTFNICLLYTSPSPRDS